MIQNEEGGSEAENDKHKQEPEVSSEEDKESLADNHSKHSGENVIGKGVHSRGSLVGDTKDEDEQFKYEKESEEDEKIERHSEGELLSEERDEEQTNKDLLGEHLKDEEQELENQEQDLINQEQDVTDQEQDIENEEQDLSSQEQGLINQEEGLGTPEQVLIHQEQDVVNQEQDLVNQEEVDHGSNEGNDGKNPEEVEKADILSLDDNYQQDLNADCPQTEGFMGVAPKRLSLLKPQQSDNLSAIIEENSNAGDESTNRSFTEEEKDDEGAEDNGNEGKESQ